MPGSDYAGVITRSGSGNELKGLWAVPHDLACKGHPNLFDSPLRTATAEPAWLHSACLQDLWLQRLVDQQDPDQALGRAPLHSPQHTIMPGFLLPWSYTPSCPSQASVNLMLMCEAPS